MIEEPYRQSRAWEDMSRAGTAEGRLIFPFPLKRNLIVALALLRNPPTPVSGLCPSGILAGCLCQSAGGHSPGVTLPTLSSVSSGSLRPLLPPQYLLPPLFGLPPPTPFLPSLHRFPWMCEHMQGVHARAHSPLGCHSTQNHHRQRLDRKLCWGS